MCYQYKMKGDVEWGGFWKLANKKGECDGKNVEEIVNEDEAYALWTKYCFEDEHDGCLCNRKVKGGIEIVPPGKDGECPKNSGPLLDADALKAGAVALHCANDICEPKSPKYEGKKCDYKDYKEKPYCPPQYKPNLNKPCDGFGGCCN